MERAEIDIQTSPAIFNNFPTYIILMFCNVLNRMEYLQSPVHELLFSKHMVQSALVCFVCSLPLLSASFNTPVINRTTTMKSKVTINVRVDFGETFQLPCNVPAQGVWVLKDAG